MLVSLQYICRWLLCCSLNREEERVGGGTDETVPFHSSFFTTLSRRLHDLLAHPNPMTEPVIKLWVYIEGRESRQTGPSRHGERERTE